MSEEATHIELPDGRAVTALWTAVDRPSWIFVYAPGAGSNVRDPFGAAAAQELAERRIATLRFQFPYSEQGRKAPDREPVLEATWRAALGVARERAERVVVGGRSMGGRIATQVVSQGEHVDAIGAFAYPLHPPGRPERRRDVHLGTLDAPILFCSGTNDAFASPDELEELAGRVPGATLHLLAGADHGFAVPKSSGRTRPDVWHEAIETFASWLAALERDQA